MCLCSMLGLSPPPPALERNGYSPQRKRENKVLIVPTVNFSIELHVNYEFEC